MNVKTIGRLLPEWLDSNYHRSYPLDDSADGNGLPTSFLVDALFLVSDNVDSTNLFISSIFVSGDNVQIELSGTVNGSDVNFGTVAIIPFTTAKGSNIAVEIVGEAYTITGNFVVGDVKSMEKVPSILNLSKSSGRIFPGCVRTISDMLFGIKVNDTIYTGVVTLVAGTGIDIDVEELENETVINIKNSEYELPDENKIIVNDQTLLDNAIKNFGYPIRTICGVPPNINGDITFSTPESGEDADKYVVATGAGAGSIYLTIANDSDEFKCIDKSAQIESLGQTLTNLNERAANLDEVLAAIETANSNLSLQISRS